MENSGNKVYITMFHSFSFKYHDKTIDSETMKSEKLVKLFTYLLINYQRSISTSELADVLWYFEDIDNPVGALKNLIYRLRSLLKKEFQITDFVLTGKQSYSINTDYELHLDVVEFDNYNHLLANSKEDTEENYKNLIKLYNGKFLSEIKGDHSILSKSAYYHSIYIDRVIEYANLLEETKQYEQMELLARKAIEIDDLEEELYEILIRSLYFQREYKKANEVYRSTTDLLYEALGIKPSQSLQDLHKLIKNESHDENSDILEVQQELIEQENDKKGAFFCEYGTFKEMYIIQSRTIGRLGICAHLCLITLHDHSKFESDRENNKQYMEKLMRKIQNALCSGLRIGDVVSRLSVNQFVVLLPTCNYENSVLVIDRVLKKIRYSLNLTNFTIDVSIEEITPKE